MVELNVIFQENKDTKAIKDKIHVMEEYSQKVNSKQYERILARREWRKKFQSNWKILDVKKI